MSDLYTDTDMALVCNACGAFTLTKDPRQIEHYPNCGGLGEVGKWDRYYSSPEWEKAVTGKEEVG